MLILKGEILFWSLKGVKGLSAGNATDQVGIDISFAFDWFEMMVKV